MATTQNPRTPAVAESSVRAAAPTRSLFPLPDDVAARMQSIGLVLEGELAVAETRDAKATLQYEVAEIEERVRGDEPSAARAYLSAFNARPAFRAPLDALIRLYTRRRSTANLAKLYETLVKAASTVRDRADALVLRGELQEDALGDAAAARASFEAAVTTDPNHRVGWIDLERSALRSGDNGMLVRAIERLADLSRDPVRKARLLLELAAEQSRLGTPGAIEEAAHRLHQAAALPLVRWRTLQELERFGERHGRPHDVVFALEARAALAEAVAAGAEFQGGSGAFSVSRLASIEQASLEAAELWSRAARLRFAALGDPEGARAAMDRAVSLRPTDARVRYAAMGLCDRAGDIEASSEHAGWLLDHDFGDPAVRASLHFRLAEVAALRGDLPAASTALRAALVLDPGSAAARGALLEQLLAGGDALEAVREFDAIAAESAPGSARASVFRAAGALTLALRADIEGALTRFRKACDDDPGDLTSRRVVVLLLARAAATAASAEDALALQRARVAAIDALLPHAADGDERAALLLERFYAERHDLRDVRAAALTAERLVEVTTDARWAEEAAATMWAAAGNFAAASRWAERLASRDDHTEAQAATAWKSAAARFAWAAGDDQRGRELALAAQSENPADDYATALALSLSLAVRDAAALLQVASRRAAVADDEEGARWMILAALLLGRLGDEEGVRAAIEIALQRAPSSPVVRAAGWAATRWRRDAALRARLQGTAELGDDAVDEDLAGALELALVQAFVDHDAPAALASVENAARSARGATSAPVLLLRALLRGATAGPEARETAEALRALRALLDVADPVRAGVELELSRSPSPPGGVATMPDPGATEAVVSTAPRLMALLDAIRREGRDEVPEALRRLAERSDPEGASALNAFAVAALRAQGRTADARAVALSEPETTASTVALSETPPGLDRAAEHAAALARRAALATPLHRTQWLRRAAHWASLAGDHAAALAHAEEILALVPDDLVALDVKRVAGRRAQRWEDVAAAAEALATTLRRGERAAAAWEEAGVVAAESLDDAFRAERCLRRSLELQASRRVAYERLREILEARRDTSALEALVTERVRFVEEPGLRAALFWEQARLRRALGLREGALDAARRVVAIDAGHVAARALIAEIHAVSGRFAETAEALVALAECPDAPAGQRRVARSGALELFEHRLGRPERAIEQIDALLDAGEGEEALVERGFAVAVGADRWKDAYRYAARAAERGAPGAGRATQRLRVARLLRDRLNDVAGARREALRAHDEAPADLGVLETLVALCDPDDRGRYARRSVEVIREALRAGIPRREGIIALAEAARLGGDIVLERAAQRLAAALGAEFRAPRVGDPHGRVALRDPALVLRYRDPADGGRALALLETLMPDLAELAGLSVDGLKVGRGDRLKGPSAHRAAVAPLLALLGISDFEVYVGGPDAARIAVVPGDPCAVVLGRGVSLPFDSASRFEILRQVLLVSRGLGALASLPLATSVLWGLAAMAAAELPLAGGTRGAELVQKPIAKAMSRRVRRAIAESSRALAANPGAAEEIAAAAAAARSSARRAAVAITGALDAGFRDLAMVDPSSARPLAEALEASVAAREFALYLVSDACAQVLRETGVDAG